MMDGLQMPEVDRTTARVFAGRYEVERMIARGGMGEVYLCTDRDLNRPVALKILRGGVDSDDGGRFKERFRLEARTLATLNHPHIVTLYEYGETDDGQLFLALEYIEGPRFTDLVRKGPMNPDRVVSLTMQVCRALRFAHRRGVVHRDLKPSNLLVRIDEDGEEQIKVVDFGLVKVVEDDQALTRAGLILGSPHCMAPEQIRGLKAVDHRVDIYAVGVLMFRALTGVWPFHGETSTATMIAHINQPVPRFADVSPDVMVAPGLEDIIRQCLEKDPNARFADVSALMAALRALTGQPATVTHSTIETAHPTGDSPTITASAAAISSSQVRSHETVRRPHGGAQGQLALVGMGAGLAAVLLLMVIAAWSLSRWTVTSTEPLPSNPVVSAPAEPVPAPSASALSGGGDSDAASEPDAGEPTAADDPVPAEDAGDASPPEAAPEPKPKQPKRTPKPRSTSKPKEPAPKPEPAPSEAPKPSTDDDGGSRKPTERDQTYDADDIF